MPRTRSLAWSELKIGVVAVAAIALATLLIVAVGGAAGFSWQRYDLKTNFPDVKGLKSGAVVRVAGVEVGKVGEVALSGAQVEVILEIKKGNEQRITTESRASIGSLSLLGEPVIDITPGDDRNAAQGWRLHSGRPFSRVDRRRRGHRARDRRAAERDSDGCSRGQGHARQGRHRRAAVQGAHRTARVGPGRHEHDSQWQGLARAASINDPAAYDRLNASLADLQAITKRINAGEGSLGRLLKDDALAKSLTSAIGELRRHHRPAAPERQHDGQADDRERALRTDQFAHRAASTGS